MGDRRGPLAPPGNALLDGDAPGAVQARLRGVHALLRHAVRRPRGAVHQRFHVRHRSFRSTRTRSPSASRAPRRRTRRSSGASSCASGTRRSSPRRSKFHRELQAVDPEQLSDEVLSAHLAACRDHHSEMIYQHMRFTAASMLPTGDFLAHVGRLDRHPARRAARPDARRGAGLRRRVRRARRTLIDAIAADADARGAARSPTAIRARSSRRCARATTTAGRAATAYLDLVGYRLLDGFDISGRYALEMPDALLRAIRVAVETAARSTDDVEAQGRPRCARQVPEEHRAEFDELLAEARLMYRLRDERGVFSDIWASGLMRRAAMARRAAARRAPGASTTPSTSSTPASTRCARCSPARTSRRPTSSRRATPTARRATRSPRRACSAPPPPPPPDPSGLPPAPRASCARWGS